MEIFESFYNIPPDIGVTESEYDLEKDLNFDNYEYLTPPSFDDDWLTYVEDNEWF